MKFSVAIFFMCLIIIGGSSINLGLYSILNIEEQNEIIQTLWFLFCLISGGLVGWFGSKYMFSQFFK